MESILRAAFMIPATDEEAWRLDRYLDALSRMDTVRRVGRVVEMVGLLVESEGPAAAVGDFAGLAGGFCVGVKVGAAVTGTSGTMSRAVGVAVVDSGTVSVPAPTHHVTPGCRQVSREVRTVGDEKCKSMRHR